MTKPTVTVSVQTYNSSKYVLETLESIKAQTYPNLILQICDDCSTDNTIELCKNWIEMNKDRFVKTKIIIPEHNTGISGNCNRAWSACETEWYKGISGDDLLIPECVEEFVNYVCQRTNIVCVLSKIKCFGENRPAIEKVEKVFDYNFFNLSINEQIDRLLVEGNCIPAASEFCNITKLRQMNFQHDERLPMYEDLPKWINLLRAGVKLYFIDKELVLYRVGSGVSTGVYNSRFVISSRMFRLFYVFPYKYEKNPNEALNELADYEINLLKIYDQYIELKNSTSIKLYSHIVSFLWKLSHLFK